MSAALDFQPASKLGPSLSGEEELEGPVRTQTAHIELLKETEPGQAVQGLKGEESQALLRLLNDLGEKNKTLDTQAVKQAGQIADLSKALKEAQEDIEQIRLYFPALVAEDRRNISELRESLTIQRTESRSINGLSVKSHLDNLYDHMKSIGRKQVRFVEAAKILGISRQRVHQFKAEIALDNRFIILDSESHKKRKLIRLREYYQKT
jgi:seryl-tRNA synthetase